MQTPARCGASTPRFAAAVLMCTLAIQAQSPPPPQLLDPDLHHLGDSVLETWTDVPAEPEDIRWALRFTASRNAGEHVLTARHRDVDEPWTVRLNGQDLGTLERTKALTVQRWIVPAGTLRDGANELLVEPAKPTDDIVFGDVQLHAQSLRDLLRLQPVDVLILEADAGPVPAKLTITDADGGLARPYAAAQLHTAVRDGIVYTGTGRARLELPPGRYRIYASRGFEWSVHREDLTVPDADAGTAPASAVLTIRREVDTAGYVAADTHVHTLTHSGHGDASVEERLVTLAGEGVELAIATDHNHHTDYTPLQRELKLDYFTSVVGNEVSTDVGHMNAFPLDPHDAPPDHTLTDWIQLVDGIRAKGAKVVILNHPRWPQIPTGPFGVFHLHRLTGELQGQNAVPFDAMELINSTTLQPDPMYLFVDWFALLNHGERITAVGVSDSHTVGKPVGQGRTYVRSKAADPAAIDVDEACQSFLDGDTSVSLGIYAEVWVQDRYRMGETVVTQNNLTVSLRVAAPSWVRPRVARVFINGTAVAEQEVPVREAQPTDVRLTFTIEPPPHDAWLVCAVFGDGVKEPFWPTEKPYTVGATNPVYLDGDGDGVWLSPRAVAQALIARHGLEPAALGAALAPVDDAVAIEAASLLRASCEATQPGSAADALEALVESTASRAALQRYLKTLEPPQQGHNGEAR
ncbi:MAG: CehA/McbA family metallohydrolase [Planctomycetota bacterium]